MTISIGVILILVLLGAILITLELFYIPGSTVVGLCGIAAAGSGIYFTYHHYGSLYGHTILGISIVLNSLLLLLAYKYAGRGDEAVKAVLDYRIEGDKYNQVVIGDLGKALGDLRPVGKVRFYDKIYDVHSEGKFIADGSFVEIVRIDNNKLIVRETDQKPLYPKG
jgi:membrane-bound ClpP family serine protease